MKKLLLLLMAVALLCPKETNAQDGKGSIHFVPYVGVNYSDFSGDTQKYFEGTSGKVNFMVGARFEFQIAEKSAFIADLNYRRLGATAENIKMFGRSLPTSSIEINGQIVDNSYESFENSEKRKFWISEANSTKVTLDCITFGAQFKQNLFCGLSARAGVEGTFSVAEKMHFHYMSSLAYNDENGNTIKESYDEEYGKEDVGSVFSDHLNIAIPLGLTYDYKNFSMNATYHLPLTKCASESDRWGDYSLRNQSFDLTLGYRIPLRKK